MGHVSAACVSLQTAIGRPLLWSGCCHHIGEVILTHGFADLYVEISKSPDVSLFLRYRKNFQLVPQSSDQALSRFDIETVPPTGHALLQECRENVLPLASSTIIHQHNDYLEFAEHCVILLDAEWQSLRFTRPGAVHKARWMAKLLYAIKICLSEKQIQHLPPGTITTCQHVAKIRQFVVFITYLQHMVDAVHVSVDAPWHDLCLVH